MKILNRIITFVTTVFVIIACIVFAATAICKIGNIEPRIVLSGSMEPKIHTGSICFINKKVPYDKIKTGDIIAFKAGKNTMVTHRVISVTNAGFETKGDANKVSDGISTNKTNYRGKTILSIPYAGLVDYERLLDYLTERTYAGDGLQETNLTGLKFTLKGVDYEVLEHTKDKYRVLMLNRKAISK